MKGFTPYSISPYGIKTKIRPAPRLSFHNNLYLKKYSAVKILIVDDEELDLFINKKLLSLEFETVGFTSVKDTLRWAHQNDFDVAVIDYYLGPGIYANHLLTELIAIKGSTFIAFVVSNYVDGKQMMDLKESGFTDIIYKPLTLETFKKKLDLGPPL